MGQIVTNKNNQFYKSFDAYTLEDITRVVFEWGVRH